MKARENALILLNKIEKENSYANLELKNGLVCEEKDKSLASEIVYGVLRYKLNLDYVISLYSKLKPNRISLTVRNILRLSAYQSLYLDRIPKSAVCNEGVKLARKYTNKGSVSFVNAILRKITLIDKESIVYPSDKREYLKVKYSFPEDIIDVFIKDYGIEKTKELLVSLNKNKGICLRPNLICSSYEKLEKALKENNIEYTSIDNKAFLISKQVKLVDELFEKGLCTVQDRASMLVVELLSPKKGEKILDLCAAPGGKSCYIAEIAGDECEVISCDIHKHRVELIKKTAERLGIKSVIPTVNDGTIFNEKFKDRFDKILVDAPCSGLGVIAKKPDIKWANKDYDELNFIQSKILDVASKYLKTGGKLVYSTCTINKKENEEVVGKFLENHSDFKITSEPIQLFPSLEHNGFFMCSFERVNNE